MKKVLLTLITIKWIKIYCNRINQLVL